MRKFFLRGVLVISPLLLLFVFFMVLDPFAMFDKPGKYSIGSSMNDDAQTFRTFELYNKSLKFNSFVLGNSKTLAILSTDWKKHIGTDNSIYKFGSPGESILNIRNKLAYAVKSGNKIENAIILLDDNILINTDNLNPDFTGPVYLKGTKSSNNSWLDYLGKGFYYYLYDGFFITHFKDICRGNKIQTDENNINWNIIENAMTKEEFNKLYQSNEFYRWNIEQKIRLDSVSWVTALPQIKAGITVSAQTIDSRNLIYLREIKRIFDQNKTNYKIVYGPEYGCIKMNPKIKEELNVIYGTTNVYDFSSDTNYCNQPINYYDPSHYRPIVGRKMLEVIYH